jgi:hypothetical protein
LRVICGRPDLGGKVGGMDRDRALLVVESGAILLVSIVATICWMPRSQSLLLPRPQWFHSFGAKSVLMLGKLQSRSLSGKKQSGLPAQENFGGALPPQA